MTKTGIELESKAVRIIHVNEPRGCCSSPALYLTDEHGEFGYRLSELETACMLYEHHNAVYIIGKSRTSVGGAKTYRISATI